MKTKTAPPATKPTIGEDIVRFAIATVFVTMTMAFLLVPYALSSHPGDPVVAANSSNHHAG
jgi:hypothetical protein